MIIYDALLITWSEVFVVYL